MPSVVRKKLEVVKGSGGLVEPEELDRLEKAGYVHGVSTTNQIESRVEANSNPKPPSTVLDAVAEAKKLAEEEKHFQRELRQVQIEEVSDEDR